MTERPSPGADALAKIPTPSRLLQSFWGTRPGNATLSLIAGYFHATLEGQEHIPQTGGTLVVSNHALFALDTVALGSLLVRELQRNPRFLADRMLWKIPGLREAITAIGALAGDPDAAETLLRAGELVVVYPGGVDDSLKLQSERYQLKWKTRAGFARVAMTAKVPIVPVVGFGIDDAYTVLAREPLLGRRLFGSKRYDLPVFVGAFGTLLPRRATCRFVALPPIDTSGDPNDPQAVERVRAATHDAIEAQLSRLRKGA